MQSAAYKQGERLTHTHTHIYRYIYIYTHIHTHTCVCVCVCVCEGKKWNRKKERKREHRPSPTYAISSYTISDQRHYLKVKKLNINISEALTEFFHAVTKEQRGAGGGRMLLGDNTGGRTVLLPPLRFRCFNRTALHIDTQLTTCIPNCDLLQTFRNVKCCVKSGTVCTGIGLRVISGAQTTLMSSHTPIWHARHVGITNDISSTKMAHLQVA